MTPFWGLAGLMQRKICLVEPILYSVRCRSSFQLPFMWYPQCLIQPIIGVLIWGSRGHPQQVVSGRHPYLIMVSYTIYVSVLRCWYLVRLTKMHWDVGLYLQTCHHELCFVHYTYIYIYICLSALNMLYLLDISLLCIIIIKQIELLK